MTKIHHKLAKFEKGIPHFAEIWIEVESSEFASIEIVDEVKVVYQGMQEWLNGITRGYEKFLLKHGFDCPIFTVKVLELRGYVMDTDELDIEEVTFLCLKKHFFQNNLSLELNFLMMNIKIKKC